LKQFSRYTRLEPRDIVRALLAKYHKSALVAPAVIQYAFSADAVSAIRQ
jgi:hypothetical protein